MTAEQTCITAADSNTLMKAFLDCATTHCASECL
jgi:hypothetical protein